MKAGSVEDFVERLPPGAPDAAPAPHGGRLIDLVLPPAPNARRLELERLVASATTKTARRIRKGPEDAQSLPHSIAASWTLTARQACDLELLLNGAFSPLTGFMSRPTYEAVRDLSRLLGVTDGHVSPEGYAPLLWPMPIMLDLPSNIADTLDLGDGVLLRDEYFNPVALLTVGGVAQQSGRIELPKSVKAVYDVVSNTSRSLRNEWIWRTDVEAEALAVFGTTDASHPGVAHLFHHSHPVYVGGAVEGLRLPARLDFPSLRLTPAQVRARLLELRWASTVAFQTRNPMHRAHIELTRLAARRARAGVLLHPVVGVTKPGDVDYTVRVQCYLAMLSASAPPAPYFAKDSVLLALLPLAMRMAGPREALWHALVRKNFGASHFIVGRDHAGCKDASGRSFYDPYAAQVLLRRHEESGELGLQVLAFQEIEYVPLLDSYFPSDLVPHFPRREIEDALKEAGESRVPLQFIASGGYNAASEHSAADSSSLVRAPTRSISGTRFRDMMARGESVPTWFSDPSVMAVLSARSPPLHERGFAVFFTGLSGGGKTTVSAALVARLQSLFPTRRMSVLDGDLVRRHLSRGLGFSIADRNANVERIGFVAAEAVRHGGIVIAAPIAPFESGREAVRRLVSEAGGGFFLVHAAALLGECALRDVKKLYAGTGLVEAVGEEMNGSGSERDSGSVDAEVNLYRISIDLTGVSHPYELPERPDIVLQTGSLTVADAAAAVIGKLVASGYLQKTGRLNGVVGGSELLANEMAIAEALKARDRGTPVPSLRVESTLQESSTHSSIDDIFPRDASRLPCSASWDVFDLHSDEGNVVRLHGGLPMRGSLHALELLQRRYWQRMHKWQAKRDAPKSGKKDQGGSTTNVLRKLAAPIRVGQTPAKLMLRINVSSFSGEDNDLSLTLRPSEVMAMGSNCPRQQLSRLRLKQIIEHAPKLADFSASSSFGGGGRLADREAEDAAAELEITPLFEDEPALVVSDTDVAKLAGALSSSALVAAAYDLWTALRWSRSDLDTDSILVVDVGDFSTVSPLLPSLLAFDPCLELTFFGLGDKSTEESDSLLQKIGVKASPRIYFD